MAENAKNEIFSIAGVVVHGDKRGREIGFPTANIPVDEAVLNEAVILRDGVYTSWLERADGTRLAATTSVGHRPTFYGKDAVRLVEVYVLDFCGDLYGEAVTVRFVERLRPQRAFDSVETLVAQLEADVAHTRQWAEQAERAA